MNKGDAGARPLDAELAHLEQAERDLAAREARRAASRDARARAEAALRQELESPLVPTSPKHDLERIRAMQPKVANPFHDAPARKEKK